MTTVNSSDPSPQSSQDAPGPWVCQLFLGPMGNCVYILADHETRAAFLIDPAWDPQGLLQRVRDEDLSIAGALITHTHQDHIGGDIFGQHIPGVRELLTFQEIPFWVHSTEADRFLEVTGADSSLVHRIDDGDEIALGNLRVHALHTPGHSPGGVSFLCEEHLFSGDTLFVQGCGRVDLPGSDPDALYHSLTRLATLPDTTRVYPGHHYGPFPTSTIADEKRRNLYLHMPDLEAWRQMMGYPTPL